MTGAPEKGGLRQLVGASLTYGIGSVLSRSLAFVLLPLYTRHLTPTDYGVVAVTLTISSVLGVILPLGLQGAVARFYFASSDEDERRATNGTLWVASILAAGLLTFLLDRLGGRVFGTLLPAVPFDPYIRLAIWTSFLTVLGLVPLAILQVQERPMAYVSLSFASSLLSTAGIVAMVVWRNEGAYGYLRGGLLGATAGAVLYLLVTVRSVKPALRVDTLRAAFLYSLPLVPHGLAGWVLELSDRAILSRFVPLSEIGIYSLGYQLGAATGIIVSAFSSAWVPILFRGLAKGDPAADREQSRLATYFIVVFFFVCVGWALLSPQVIRWLLAPRYANAYHVTRWVTLAYALSALYIIPVNLLFWRKTTWIIPLVTLSGGTINVALNLWLVPRYGTIAAAWNTVVGYGAMLAVAWIMARRRHPFPYEYGRLARVTAVALFVYGAAMLTAPGVTPPALAVRAAVWFTFPLGLVVAGVISGDQLRKAISAVRTRFV